LPAQPRQRHDDHTCSAGTLGRRASYGWLNGDAENPDFSLSHLHSTAPLEGSQTEYRHNVWYAKTRMVWLPQSEKSPRNTATRFDRIHKRHRRTDRHDDIGCAYA